MIGWESQTNRTEGVEIFLRDSLQPLNQLKPCPDAGEVVHLAQLIAMRLFD
jgi:hypothetical protein